jgi:hypothetical protein
MQGVGVVYRLYRSGKIIDDDEVALLHGPPDVGSVPVTEAMVNIRMTLRRARRLEIITAADELTISRIAKSMYYKDRTLDRILRLSHDQLGRGQYTAELPLKLKHIYRDVKREDAVLLLSKLNKPPEKALVGTNTEFVRTSFWNEFEHKHLLQGLKR